MTTATISMTTIVKHRSASKTAKGERASKATRGKTKPCRGNSAGCGNFCDKLKTLKEPEVRKKIKPVKSKGTWRGAFHGTRDF